MGSRSRRRAREAGGTETAPRPPRKSAVERDAEIRAGLVPLAPGERPRALVVATVIALLIAVANLGFLAAGWDVRGEDPSPAGVVVFSGLLVVAAVFMWRKAYWAVLGFQCLLALTFIVASLSLLVASNVRAAVLCLVIIAGAGALFWSLVRALARIQMPERPSRVSRHG